MHVMKTSPTFHRRNHEMFEAGVSLPGIRLVRDDKPDEGMVVMLTEAEQEPLLKAIRAILAARAKKEA